MLDPSQAAEKNSLHDLASSLQQSLNEIILGKEELNRMVCAAFFAGGHILLEGLPGLGKTVLAKSLSSLTGLEHKRLQFTPDLMPADITGTHMIEETSSGKKLKFIPGPVFTNFLLADEINRASPKTQAALLEAMGEASVTVVGETRILDKPFFVIATQNPIEMEGVNPLPEAQLDRFAIKFEVPPTQESVLLQIISSRKNGELPLPPPLMNQAQVLACQAAVDEIFLPEAVATLIARLVAGTSPENLKKTNPHSKVHHAVTYGSSPRGAIWLARITRALAFMDGRPGVSFEDVSQAAPYVLGHRIILNYSARIDKVTTKEIIQELFKETERDILSLSSGS